jgi:elongation factor Ts
MVTTADVKALRDATGAGVMDAKRALEEADGDFEAAKLVIQQQGLASAAKRSGRETNQGIVVAYTHPAGKGGGRIGALVELNCETDFVARTDGFQALAHEIAMQVAAMNPIAITREEIPSDIESDTEPMALMEQNSIRDGSKTVGELVQDEIAKTGENIRVARFSRFELGSSE